MTKKQLIKVAKLEIEEWEGHPKGLPRGLAMAILWAFIYRVTVGEPIEEFFKPAPPVQDYEI